MQTPLFAVLVFVILTPFAQAAPIASVVWEPNGIHTGDSAEYYLKVVLSDPEPPVAGEAENDDCAYDDRPADFAQGLSRVVEKMSQIEPGGGGFSTWFPSCMAFPITGLAGFSVAYVSYDISTGRYYVELDAPFAPLSPSHKNGLANGSYSGTTGASVLADCLPCPSPP